MTDTRKEYFEFFFLLFRVNDMKIDLHKQHGTSNSAVQTHQSVTLRSQSFSLIFELLNCALFRSNMPRTPHPVFDYFNYDPLTGNTKCAVNECNKVFKGKLSSACSRHINRCHKEIISEMHVKLTKHKKKRNPRSKSINVNVKIFRDDILVGRLESVAIDGRPFNTFQGKGMQRIIRPIIEEFDKINSHVSFSPESIKDDGFKAQEHLMELIRSELSDKLVSLQLDLTTHLGRTILGINTQYYRDSELVVRSLAMKCLTENASSLVIAKHIETVLQLFGLSVDNIYCVTSDNGANVLACTKILQIMQERRVNDFITSHNVNTVNTGALLELIEIETEKIREGQLLQFIHQIRCAAHTLNLVIGDVLGEDDLKEFLRECNDLVRKLRRPTIVNLLNRKGLKKAINDCDTRWNSVHNMVSTSF